MKQTKSIASLCSLFLLWCALADTASAQRRQRPKQAKPAEETSTAGVSLNASDETQRAELDAVLALPPAERIERLKAYVKTHQQAPAAERTRAMELLVSAHAALGDDKLKADDIKGGIAEFRRAIAAAPADMADKLFFEVVAQLPANLFLRGQSAAAVAAARSVEAKAKDDPKRLLALASFYLMVEQEQEATRIAERAVRLAPEMGAAHQALGAAHRIGFRLDEAAQEFARALELEPQSAAARRSLADLRRATGKAEEALKLYREQLTTEAKDKAARSGLVLSLFDLGKREEAEREMKSATEEEAQNLPLLVGAAYWYAAQGEGARALELAQRAVSLEPRYTWAQIAFARALIAQQRPLDAERALRFALQYGRFPTLDYELATVLAAVGLYEEAAVELARSFILKNDQLETRLAGRVAATATTFTELLAPERRASIFQPGAADTDGNAAMLKGLLAFHSATSEANTKGAAATTSPLAAKEFTAGSDAMRAFRHLYAASRLLQSGASAQTVLDEVEAAASGVEAGLDAPSATVAVLADELRTLRMRAIAAGATPALPDVPRRTLSNIVRGRLEDIAGYALFKDGKAEEAVTRLRRGASVLPENSLWWRTTQWHLGAALDASGNPAEALTAYLKGYDRRSPDPAQRAIIEAVYRKVNGSLDGFAERIGAVPTSSTNRASADSPTQKSAAPPTVSDSANSTESDPNAASTATAPPSLSTTATVTIGETTPTPGNEASATEQQTEVSEKNSPTKRKRKAVRPGADKLRRNR